MNAPAMLAELRGRGVRVAIEGGALMLDAPPGVLKPQVLEAARRLKPALLELLALETASQMAPVEGENEPTENYRTTELAELPPLRARNPDLQIVCENLQGINNDSRLYSRSSASSASSVNGASDEQVLEPSSTCEDGAAMVRAVKAARRKLDAGALAVGHALPSSREVHDLAAEIVRVEAEAAAWEAARAPRQFPSEWDAGAAYRGEPQPEPPPEPAAQLAPQQLGLFDTAPQVLEGGTG